MVISLEKFSAHINGSTEKFCTSKSLSTIDHSLSHIDLAERSQQSGHWNESLLLITKKMVCSGASDREIHAFTDALTTDGYTLEETRTQVQHMIDGARSKFTNYELNLSDKRDTANIFKLLTEHPKWIGVFAFDEFRNRDMIVSKPPYQRGAVKNFKPRSISDNDYTHVQMWIQREWGSANKQAVIDAVNTACTEIIISPVRHYLENLPPSDFDISCLFENYFGVFPENDVEKQYVSASSALFLKQAVARAINPGCKADVVVVIEGKQGIGKSTGLRALFNEDWFKDSLPPMASKDASDYLVGAWCVELAEMAFQRKSEIEHQKAFISRQEEKYRPAYKRNEILYPRRCVFVATTNRDDWAIDETGNRRFLPIKATKVDVGGLKRDRDIIWAAAYHEFLREPPYWMDEELTKLTAKQTEQRHEADVWMEEINKHLKDFDQISISQAFQLCFPQKTADDHGYDPRKLTKADQRRMANCLCFGGWERAGRFTTGEWRNQTKFVRKKE